VVVDCPKNRITLSRNVKGKPNLLLLFFKDISNSSMQPQKQTSKSDYHPPVQSVHQSQIKITKTISIIRTKVTPRDIDKMFSMDKK
jgi:hypothetical protein